ncbi:MAG: hypothetical protein HY305_03715 [Sphingobacteriales bacterium]|nr:hypothetical protein [Sphingobacteriales bacterium]
MKNLIPLGLLIVFLVAAQFATAQTVDEIINKYIKARGGKEKLNAIHSIYMEGMRNMMGNNILVKINKEQNKLSRIDFEMSGTNAFSVITPKEGWSYFPKFSDTAVQLPANAVEGMQSDLDIAGPLVDHLAKGHKAELIGKEMADGVPCYKIKLTTANNKNILYWIDTKDYFLIQSAQRGRSRFGHQKDGYAPDAVITTIYKNYNAVDGILFPFIIETKMEDGGNKLDGATVYSKIMLNQPVNTELYKHDLDSSD